MRGIILLAWMVGFWVSVYHGAWGYVLLCWGSVIYMSLSMTSRARKRRAARGLAPVNCLWIARGIISGFKRRSRRW